MEAEASGGITGRREGLLGFCIYTKARAKRSCCGCGVLTETADWRVTLRSGESLPATFHLKS